MLLQTRGKLSAETLARELEVSERTIYRDLEALGMAGIPVYAERGPGGGISLLEDYTTRLNGLTVDEARALFMLSIPGPLLQLGVGPDLKAAMLKLSAALPQSQRQEEESARQRIHLDASDWGPAGAGAGAPHLGVIQQALWQNRRLELLFHTLFGIQIEVSVDPLGLVAKAYDWHLVARYENGLRVFRVHDLLRVRALDENFERPPDFSLSAFWQAYCQQTDAGRGQFWVVLRISPGLAEELPMRLSEGAERILAGAGPADEHGWRTVRMAFDSFEQARDKVLTFGGAAEVLDPLALALSLADHAEQIRMVYASARMTA